MSLMTTKMVVQKKLRELIHPELVIVNVDGSAENSMPEDAYVALEELNQERQEAPKHGMMENIKQIIGL